MLPDNLPKVLMKDMGLISRAVSTAAADSFAFSVALNLPLFLCVGVFFMAVCVCLCLSFCRHFVSLCVPCWSKFWWAREKLRLPSLSIFLSLSISLALCFFVGGCVYIIFIFHFINDNCLSCPWLRQLKSTTTPTSTLPLPLPRFFSCPVLCCRQL